MRLDGDKIVIESRYEIDDIQKMIECFLKHEKPQRLTEKELKDLRNNLDGLFMYW